MPHSSRHAEAAGADRFVSHSGLNSGNVQTYLAPSKDCVVAASCPTAYFADSGASKSLSIITGALLTLNIPQSPSLAFNVIPERRPAPPPALEEVLIGGMLFPSTFLVHIC
jgi:hypothetical protein